MGQPEIPLTQRLDTYRRWVAKTRPQNGCLLWTGARCGSGYDHSYPYGHMRAPLTPSGYAKAHRVAFWLFFPNTYDPDLEIDHLCGNALCVHPDHLEQVTSCVNKIRQNSNEDRDIWSIYDDSWGQLY